MSNVQHRTPRLLIGALLPAVVFSFIIVILVTIGIRIPHLPVSFGSLAGFAGLILSGWILCGVQSVIYSVLMEFVVNPKIKDEYIAIIANGFMITVAVLTVFPGYSFILSGAGFVSGCIVGYLLRDMYKHYS